MCVHAQVSNYVFKSFHYNWVLCVIRILHSFHLPFLWIHPKRVRNDYSATPALIFHLVRISSYNLEGEVGVDILVYVCWWIACMNCDLLSVVFLWYSSPSSKKSYPTILMTNAYVTVSQEQSRPHIIDLHHRRCFLSFIFQQIHRRQQSLNYLLLFNKINHQEQEKASN